MSLLLCKQSVEAWRKNKPNSSCRCPDNIHLQSSYTLISLRSDSDYNKEVLTYLLTAATVSAQLPDGRFTKNLPADTSAESTYSYVNPAAGFSSDIDKPPKKSTHF